MADRDLTYKIGTVSVGASGTVVTGAGGMLWSQSPNVRQWDAISINGLPAVPIVASAVDDTHLTIPAWQGGTLVGVPYVIYQFSPLRFVGGQAMADVDDMLAKINTDGWYRYVNPAYAGPTEQGLTANEGQLALLYTTGQLWIMSGGVWVLVGVFKAYGVSAPYDNTKSYSLNDVVSLNGSSYVWINPTAGSGHAPPNATFWNIFASKGDTGAQGIQGAGYAGTSATSFAIGTSSQVFATQAGLAWLPGARARVSSLAGGGANYVEGIVTAYDNVAGNLTVNVSKIVGTGTHTDWQISLTGDPGSGDLLSTNNLSDLANAATARTNLEVPHVVTLQMFGGNPASSDSMAVVRLAAAYCNTNGITSISIDDNFVCTTYADADQALLADITFTGNGSITGIYRKHVILTHAPSDALDVMDLIPEIHLTAMNRAGASPTICIVGDSTGTYLANSIGRQVLIAEALKRKISEEFATPTFIDMSISGRSYAGLYAATGITNTWSTDPTLVWLSHYVKSAAPDVIVFDFGMNDSSSASYAQIAPIFAEVNSWPKIPDVVFCTNAVPSLAWPGSSTKVEQEGRDIAAGLTRTIAQFFRAGLLDFHRKFCMARDGFDPLSSALRTGNNLTLSGGLCTGTTECWDFKAGIHFNGVSWAAGSGTDYIIVKTGTGSADFLQITKSAGGFFTFALFGGDIGASVAIANVTTTTTIPTTAFSIVAEKFGNRIEVYIEDATFSGTYSEPIFQSRIIAKGGRYFPQVSNNGNAGVSSVDFSYGEPRYNKPSATNTQLLGNVDGLGVPYGGFGGNHLTGIGFTNVYWSIIGQSRWAGASMIGPVSSVDGTPAVFAGTSGKVLQNVGFGTFKTFLGLDNVSNAGMATAWTLDASTPTISVPTSGLAPLAAGSGKVVITDTTTTGATAEYLLGGGSTKLVAQTPGGVFVDGAVGGAQIGIVYSAGVYYISNKTAVTVVFGVGGMRTRAT